MPVFPEKKYEFVKFIKANKRDKMYVAILRNKKSGRIKQIPFGSSKHENYGDRTGLNAWPKLVHGDIKRLERYRKRHEGEGDDDEKYSAGWFAYHFLWARPEEPKKKLN